MGGNLIGDSPAMNDLSTGIDITALMGRRGTSVTAAEVRPMTEEDLAKLTGEERATKAPNLKKLRQRHHALARALASGMPQGEAAISCGYTQSYVSIIESSPAFSELVKFYECEVHKEYLGTHEAMAGLSRDTIDILTERVEENPDDLSVGQLIEISKLGLDRTGHGPQTSQTLDIKVGLADKLAAARGRITEHRLATVQANVIEGQIVETTNDS